MQKFRVYWHKWTRYRTDILADSEQEARDMITDLAEEVGRAEIRAEDIEVDQVEDVS